MSIFNDKSLKSVAEAAAKIMSEELKGNQHKIDANKNGKVDAHDFKILRGEKKPPFEGGTEKPETVTDKSGAKHTPSSRARDLARRALKKEDVELDEAKWPFDSSTPTAQKTGETTRTGHDVRKVSTGTVYTKRTAEEKPEDAAPKSRKKQKLGSTSDLMSDEEFKKKHGMSRKNYERMQSGVKIGESFTEMLESYGEYGLKSLSTFTIIQEEPDNEQFTKELKDAQAKSEGKGKKADVAAAAVKAVKVSEDVDLSEFSLEELEDFMVTEEFEQLDEISKQTLGSYVKKAAKDVEERKRVQGRFETLDQEPGGYGLSKLGQKTQKKQQKGIDKRHTGIAKAVDRLTKEEVEQIDELSKKTLSSYVKAAAQDAEQAGRDQEYHGHKNDYARGEKRQKGISKAVDRLAKEEVELEERTLSEPEMNKREEYVKGMKKKLSGFKQRYGERAKEVMYATATRMAKEDK